MLSQTPTVLVYEEPFGIDFLQKQHVCSFLAFLTFLSLENSQFDFVLNDLFDDIITPYWLDTVIL